MADEEKPLPATERQIEKFREDGQVATSRELVAALGRRDRKRSLEILDTLVRDGEYLPLALAFLATQFRFALAAECALETQVVRDASGGLV